ncbi:uncharacterized protein LOC127010644 [Drosophila biarmipes]|uniref:uncharacterized protein LOC127010644 n=1 Tax=Drosophila biarmipes TaxID=125945 RepID=UPI0021CCDD5E|nr:uncharacterized protein LOC127010644 [Drosophila biarmipes]
MSRLQRRLTCTLVVAVILLTLIIGDAMGMSSGKSRSSSSPRSGSSSSSGSSYKSSSGGWSSSRSSYKSSSIDFGSTAYKSTYKPSRKSRPRPYYSPYLYSESSFEVPSSFDNDESDYDYVEEILRRNHAAPGKLSATYENIALCVLLCLCSQLY